MSQATWLGHPRGLATLFFTEMWERFSLYGMRAILVAFLVASMSDANPGFALPQEYANAIYGLYTSAVYLAALPGGWIADKLIGHRKAVFYGGVIIAIGHTLLALNTVPTFYCGLICVALGTGLLKPNISVMVGNLYAQDDAARKDAGYSMFYMGINIGAFFGKIMCGYIGEKHGWHYGFGLAAIFMVAGLVQYQVFGHYLGNIGLQPLRSGNAAQDARTERYGWLAVGFGLTVLASVVAATFAGAITINPVQLAKNTGVGIVLVAMLVFGYLLFFAGLTKLEKQRVGVVIVLFFGAAMFWSGFEQSATSFKLFAKNYVDRDLWGWELPYTIVEAINPVFIMMLSPAFAALWINLGKRNIHFAAPVKFAMGLMFMGIGFAIVAWAATYVVQGQKVAVTWLVLTYFFHSVGELCLSPVGLSTVNKLSPAKHQSLMFGLWFTASGLGYLLAGLLAGHLADAKDVANMPSRFMFVCFTTAGAGLVMLAISKPVTRLMAGADGTKPA